MSKEYVRLEKEGKDKMELEHFTLGALRKAVFDGDVNNGSLMAGQVAGGLTEIRSISEIFKSMDEEYREVIKSLQA